MNNKSVWKTITEFPEYEISTFGVVRHKLSHIELKQIISGGYVQVIFNGIFRRYVHRLVALEFIDNPEHLPQINHKDENKQNNCIDNLEWCSAKYNSNYGTQSQKISKALSGTHSIKKSLAQIGNTKAQGKGYTHKSWHHTEEAKKKIRESLLQTRQAKKEGDTN